jgi:hypothetical protein
MSPAKSLARYFHATKDLFSRLISSIIGRGKYVRLFRAVGPLELADIQASGVLRPGPPSYQGKWFAESAEHARAWGQVLQRLTGEAFEVVQVELPREVADQMFRIAALDGIGPARFANEGLLDRLNVSHPRIRRLAGQ